MRLVIAQFNTQVTSYPGTRSGYKGNMGSGETESGHTHIPKVADKSLGVTALIGLNHKTSPCKHLHKM